MRLPFRYILTISELTRQIKDTLEDNFSDVWVEGEISNLRIPPSGHLYFTLKDDFSQIRGVLFKMRARAIRFVPEDGLQVICRGRVSLYEKRGEYQLILEEIEPKGIGALQLAFIQLKEKLEKAGFFDPDRKKPLPFLPKTIGIVTSPTGAVIQDMIQIIHRRFENTHLLLYPVRVQGEGAAFEIAEGIKYFNKKKNVDVIILGRGGGSLEDLWAFNEEGVAKAIYHSKIPVVSAVGHETDYTISDFVADLRAPTPSAAAEMVVKDKRELKNNLSYLKNRLESQMLQYLRDWRSDLSYLRRSMIDPEKRIEEYFLRVDDLFGRLQRFLLRDLSGKREKDRYLRRRLLLQRPEQRIKHLRIIISEALSRLEKSAKYILEIERERAKGVLGRLDSLSPLSILERGYSITRKLPGLQILKDASQASVGDPIEVKLHRGTLFCGVERVEES